MRAISLLVLTLFGSLISSACDSSSVLTGRVEVLETLPHDTLSYTQGLLLHEGELYESSGRYGASAVRRVDPASGQIRAMSALGEEHFAEGLALIEDRLLLLTWKERVAFRYSLDFAEIDTLEFASDGWGACYDGTSLHTTSGGSALTARDPITLQARNSVQVSRGDEAVWEVNELECVGEFIYANVYQTTSILKIEAATGRVVMEWDIADLVPPDLRGSADAVANGIAHDPATDSFYITGKLWPVMYRVRLIEEEE